MASRGPTRIIALGVILVAAGIGGICHVKASLAAPESDEGGGEGRPFATLPSIPPLPSDGRGPG